MGIIGNRKQKPKMESLRMKSVGVETVPPERTTDVQFQLSH